MNWTDLIDACEGDLRAGRLAAAAARLHGVTPNAVPRDFVATIANLARRAQLDHLGLRCLARFVRSERDADVARPREIAEYAAGLQKIGAVREALALLADPRAASEPVANLYRAFAHFRRWEYAEAVPHLNAYLGNDLSPHQILLGELNLAAALVTSDDHARAEIVLASVQDRARRTDQRRYLINALEIEAQLRVRRGAFAAARACLDEATALAPEGADAFWVAKWAAVLDALDGGSTRALIDFQVRARRAAEWESVRDADFFRLKCKPTRDRAHHLVFGTPHVAYRRRVYAEVAVPIASEWRLGSTTGPSVCLRTGDVSGRPDAAPTNGVHRTLIALTADLYRPSRVGDLFDRMFTGEHYDPHSSPNRVHQSLGRLRAWLRANDLPIEVREASGGYALRLHGPCALVLDREVGSPSSHDVCLNQLRDVYGTERWFTPREVRAHLKMSPSAFKRLAARAVTDGAFARLGSGRATRYKFAG